MSVWHKVILTPKPEETVLSVTAGHSIILDPLLLSASAGIAQEYLEKQLSDTFCLSLWRMTCFLSNKHLWNSYDILEFFQNLIDCHHLLIMAIEPSMWRTMCHDDTDEGFVVGIALQFQSRGQGFLSFNEAVSGQIPVKR